MQKKAQEKVKKGSVKDLTLFIIVICGLDLGYLGADYFGFKNRF